MGKMSDLISRSEAIKAVHEEFDDCCVWDESGEYTANEVERILESVPSESSDMIIAYLAVRKTSHWIDETDMPWGLVYRPYKCDRCGERSEAMSKFCPWCGAQMKGEEDG